MQELMSTVIFGDSQKVIQGPIQPIHLYKKQFQTILTRTFVMLSNATNQPKWIVELGHMCPQGLTGPPAVTSTKKLKYKKILLLIVYTIFNRI